MFEQLCLRAGLEAVTVVGRTQDGGLHAWNAVKVNGNWRLIDVTWCAGYVNDRKFGKKFDTYYYLTSPDLMVLDHFPDDPRWQLRDTPIDARTYQSLAAVNMHEVRAPAGAWAAEARDGSGYPQEKANRLGPGLEKSRTDHVSCGAGGPGTCGRIETLPQGGAGGEQRRDRQQRHVPDHHDFEGWFLRGSRRREPGHGPGGCQDSAGGDTFWHVLEYQVN